jgi:nitroreductase
MCREAGLVGHYLYLESEVVGMRSTGIGCFFDDPVHELLGLQDSKYQSIYHFTIGDPVVDSRISTLPPYHHLLADRKETTEPPQSSRKECNLS